MRNIHTIWTMTISVDFGRAEQSVQRLEPRPPLRRARGLTGRLSARQRARELERRDGETHKLVVRQHGAVDLSFNPNIAADEFRLLHIVHSAGLPVPEPYYVEDSGEIFETPCIVVEFVEGTPEFAPADVGDY